MVTNTALEFHDSYLIGVDSDGVLLDGMIHRYGGAFGASLHEVGMQIVRFRFRDLVVTGEIGELSADIYEGDLTINGAVDHGLIPVPSTHSGQVELRMMMREDAREVLLSGSALTIEPLGELRDAEAVDFTLR